MTAATPTSPITTAVLAHADAHRRGIYFALEDDRLVYLAAPDAVTPADAALWHTHRAALAELVRLLACYDCLPADDAERLFAEAAGGDALATHLLTIVRAARDHET